VLRSFFAGGVVAGVMGVIGGLFREKSRYDLGSGTDRWYVQSLLDNLSSVFFLKTPHWKISNVGISYFHHGTRLIHFSREALGILNSVGDDLGVAALVCHEWRHWWQFKNRYCQYGNDCQIVREVEAVHFVEDLFGNEIPEMKIDHLVQIALGETV